MNKLMITFVLLLGLNAATYAGDFPSPPEATTTLVSENMQVKGMSVQVRKFTSKKSVSSVLAFYKQRWKSQGVTTNMPPWSMIGMSKEGKFYNVQVKPSGGASWGYLSVSDLPELLKEQRFKPQLTTPFPMLSGSQVLDSQKHTNLLNKNNISMIANTFSVTGNARYYVNYYRQRGWAVRQDTKGSDMKPRVLLFSKGNQNINLTIRRTALGSEIVVNLVSGKIVGD